MNGRQLAALLATLVVLGAAGLYLRGHNVAEWKSAPASARGKIVDFPVNDVARIQIKDGSGEVNLVSGKEGWTVKERADYPASFEQISGLIRKIWELKPVQNVVVGPSQLGRLQLLEPGKGAESGTLLEFRNKDDKRLAALIAGKKFMRESDEGGGFPAGRYVMADDAAHHVALVADALSDVEVKPAQWLNKDFIKIDRPKSISLTSPTPALNWTVTRENEGAPWKLKDAKPGEELEASKTSGFASAFASPSFSDVLAPDAKLAEHGLDQPTVITIETFDGFVYLLKTGKLEGENYPVLVSVSANLAKDRPPVVNEKPEEKASHDQEFQARQKELSEKLTKEQKFQSRPYLVAKFSIEQVLKDRSQLLAEKTPPPTQLPAAAVGPAPISPPQK